MSADSQLIEAVRAHKARQYKEAESLYLQFLETNPDHLDALNNYATLLQETARPTEAIPVYQRAVAINPNNAFIQYNLGTALLAAGKPVESIAALRRALALDPKLPSFHNALANSLRAAGNLPDAIASYRTALTIQPHFPQALNNLSVSLFENGQLPEALSQAQLTITFFPQYPQAHNALGNILKAQNKLDQAIASYEKAISLNPNFADAHNNLGVALQSKGALDPSIAAFRRAIELKPDFAQAHSNLGYSLKDKGLLEDAKAAFEKSLQLDPQLVSAHLNLALLFRQQNDLDSSIDWYKRALTLESNNPVTLNGLANSEKDAGMLDDALHHYRRALELNPNSIASQSNLLYTLHFHPAYDAPKILAEHVAWARQHADPLKKEILPLQIEPIKNRRLRIGYVSPDFRNHVVGRCLLPLFTHHDHKKFEIFVYTDVRHEDSLTTDLRSHADHWLSTVGITNSDLANQIRQDKIDILIDLTLHSSGSRLLAFARKPAPIQLTWLGYPSTTGLTTMDYRLSDPYLDPSASDSDYTEKTIRLPKTYWCYQPAGPTPEISPLPAQQTDHITFGCLNKFGKVSKAALELWSKLLQLIPNSSLLLYIPPGSVREKVKAYFSALPSLGTPGEGKGGGSANITFFSGAPWETYIAQYNKIDIALDPFPHAGGITTCDALYMGVPVITLLGQTAVGRGGASILSNLALPDLIAKTPDQYLQIATNLAADRPRLAALRSTLRQRMQNSPLMDAQNFARDIESVYHRLAQENLPQ